MKTLITPLLKSKVSWTGQLTPLCPDVIWMFVLLPFPLGFLNLKIIFNTLKRTKWTNQCFWSEMNNCTDLIMSLISACFIFIYLKFCLILCSRREHADVEVVDHFFGLALSVLVATNSPEMKQKLSGKNKFQRLYQKKPHKPDPISISINKTDRCGELQLQPLWNIRFYAAS